MPKALKEMTNDELLTKAEAMSTTGEKNTHNRRFNAILTELADRPMSAGETSRLVSLKEEGPTANQAEQTGERPTVEA